MQAVSKDGADEYCRRPAFLFLRLKQSALSMNEGIVNGIAFRQFLALCLYIKEDNYFIVQALHIFLLLGD